MKTYRQLWPELTSFNNLLLGFKKAARRARFYKQPVTLEAMSAYDRRIIHTELAAHPDIKTESTGEGLQRRVVVKFIE